MPSGEGGDAANATLDADHLPSGCTPDFCPEALALAERLVADIDFVEPTMGCGDLLTAVDLPSLVGHAISTSHPDFVLGDIDCPFDFEGDGVTDITVGLARPDSAIDYLDQTIRRGRLVDAARPAWARSDTELIVVGDHELVYVLGTVGRTPQTTVVAIGLAVEGLF